jgi:succinate dehydrogenase / fumarate reductase, iron-sulfur subunit
MAAFTLPTNSKISQDKTSPMPQGSNLRSFKIYRWNQDDGNPKAGNFANSVECDKRAEWFKQL